MSVEPPRPKLPPLNALRAFEAAARMESFKAAGEELHVSAGAIAQHVKALETWAGGDLFHRNARGVELTELGSSVLPAFTEAFDRLGEAVHGLFALADPQQVRIAALPSIAQLWISPRLPLIRERLPDLQLSVTALEQMPNPNRDLYDICLFFEDGDLRPDTQTHDVCDDVIFPVCTSKLAKRLCSPRDLASVTLLADSQWEHDWWDWLRYAAPGVQLDARRSVFSLYSLAVEEALSGAGVLIAHEPLVQRFLEKGSLVAPFAGRLKTGRGLRLRVQTWRSAQTEIQQVVELLCS